MTLKEEKLEMAKAFESLTKQGQSRAHMKHHPSEIKVHTLSKVPSQKEMTVAKSAANL